MIKSHLILIKRNGNKLLIYHNFSSIKDNSRSEVLIYEIKENNFTVLKKELYNRVTMGIAN